MEKPTDIYHKWDRQRVHREIRESESPRWAFAHCSPVCSILGKICLFVNSKYSETLQIAGRGVFPAFLMSVCVDDHTIVPVVALAAVLAKKEQNNTLNKTAWQQKNKVHT